MENIKPIHGIFYKDFNSSYIPEILKEIYRERIYAPYLEGKTDLTIMDVGANIGLFSQYAYPFAQKVYSLEPSKDHFETMNFMLNFNMLHDKVVPINKALSHEDGKTTFYHSDNATMYSLRPEINTKPDEAEEVTTIRLDTVFRDYQIEKIDFMKLDVEGSEVEIISGEGFQSVSDKIGAMVVEYHNWSGRNPSQLVTALEDYGFIVKAIPAEAILFGAVRR